MAGIRVLAQRPYGHDVCSLIHYGSGLFPVPRCRRPLKPEASTMLPSCAEYTALRVYAILSVLLLFRSPVHAADYTVKRDGSGDFTTIQACADVARAGDSCAVYPGVYSEHVRTTAGGNGDSARIMFKAQGIATMRGFDVRHPFVTIEGFDITGYTLKYQGQITVFSGGNDCRIVNNTLRDGAADVYGVYFYVFSGLAASDCVVSGNKLSNLNGIFLTLNGDNHLIQGNVLELQNNTDYVRLFGSNHVFRRNVFWRGTTQASSGNHPDFVQTFGGEGLESQNHLFEENWIQDLPSQFSQMDSGDGVVVKGVLHTNVKNVIFRRNVIVSVSLNANVGMPGVRFENNTFYRMSYQRSGIGYSGSLTRGDASFGVLKNNVFLAGGARADLFNDFSGFYFMTGAVMSREVIGAFVTNDPLGQNATSTGIFSDLNTNGYIDVNGKILAKATALSGLSQFVMNTQYAAYKGGAYDTLMKTVALDRSIRSTFLADYNFVAGAESSGFAPKRNGACDALKTYTEFNFCEPHGVNGGDPQLQNLANPLGLDGLPFTIDDGLKPVPTSPVCGSGQGTSDIGAYSCDPMKVLSDDRVPPPPPANLRIVR